jgi:perosamine synthetase
VSLIEDAAEAAGSSFAGTPAGGFGVTSVFSFHGSKTLTTGEGGMLVTDDEELFQRVLVLRDHGRDPDDVEFFNREVAFKYKMGALQAALGLAQLERLDELVARKRQIFQWYHERLLDLDVVTLNAEPSDVVNSYWMVGAVIDPSLDVTKTDVRQALAADGIDSRPFFHPLSSLPAYSHLADGRARADNPVTYRISPFGINLPSALCLTEAQVDRVCATFRRFVLRR